MSVAVFTGGGTAGHYAPNIAVMEKAKRFFDEVYIGSELGPERAAMEKLGVAYFPVTVARLERRATAKNLAVPFLLAKGVAEARKALKEIKPSVVFSKGGYVALPVCIAARSLSVPVVIHESDYSIGLANRIAAKFADLVLTSFEDTAKGIKGARCIGSPLRSSLFAARDKAAAAEKFGLRKGMKTLLVTGGSQGSAAINDAVRKSVYNLVKRYNVLHICGRGKASGIEAEGYTETEFAEDIGEYYAVSDLAVTRAGANTLFELTALGIPALAIPLPKGNSRGDQIENAKYFAENGLIASLPEEQLTPARLEEAIYDLERASESIRAACAKKAMGDAAEKAALWMRAVAGGGGTKAKK